MIEIASPSSVGLAMTVQVSFICYGDVIQIVYYPVIARREATKQSFTTMSEHPPEQPENLPDSVRIIKQNSPGTLTLIPLLHKTD